MIVLAHSKYSFQLLRRSPAAGLREVADVHLPLLLVLRRRRRVLHGPGVRGVREP